MGEREGGRGEREREGGREWLGLGDLDCTLLYMEGWLVISGRSRSLGNPPTSR